MEQSQLNEIFNRFLGNRASKEEAAYLFSYFNTSDEAIVRRLILNELEQPDEAADAQLQTWAHEVYQSIKQEINKERPYADRLNQGSQTARVSQLWIWYAVAASVLLFVALGVYFIPSSTTPQIVKAKVKLLHDIAPGGNKAVLILSNGQQINLGNAKNGQLAQEANAVINKRADGQVIYQVANNKANTAAKAGYNILQTPRGGKYDLTLADGTRVWLNAASSIKYPSVFNGNSREVEITGEAYFVVVHDAAKPFKVKVAGQTIEDLGTQFNVNAYADEPAVTTTLLEGSIKLNNAQQAVTLKPGQQAVVKQQQAIVIKNDVDLEEAIAWHKGLFKFNDASIQEVMRQLARWYDVEVSYEGTIPTRRFSGKIYRNSSALKVSDILSYKQIHFRIEGRKIIVMP